MVFAAFMQHCIQSTVTHLTHVEDVKDTIVLCIQGPSPLQGGKLFIWAFHPVGLAVRHHAVQGGSFVNFLGLVKLQGWLQARHTANPQFLKLNGAQQPGNSYKSMTKLHPPYPNWTCHKQII